MTTKMRPWRRLPTVRGSRKRAAIQCSSYASRTAWTWIAQENLLVLFVAQFSKRKEATD